MDELLLVNIPVTVEVVLMFCAVLAFFSDSDTMQILGFVYIVWHGEILVELVVGLIGFVKLLMEVLQELLSSTEHTQRSLSD